jgi:hypothetical protein
MRRWIDPDGLSSEPVAVGAVMEAGANVGKLILAVAPPADAS